MTAARLVTSLDSGDNVKLGSLGLGIDLCLRPYGVMAPPHTSKHSFLVVEIDSVIFELTVQNRRGPDPIYAAHLMQMKREYCGAITTFL